MPKVSIIVPVYKVEPYIHRCIDSILAQTFTDFELILVDDGSPDRCGEICDEYAAKDKRIVVIHQENGGLSAARNAGIDWAFANSDSQWLTFIDSDDWVHPEYLQRLYSAAADNDVLVSISGYVETNGDEPIVLKEQMIPQIWTSESFYVEHRVDAIIACAKLYNKECFKTIRYPVGKLHEDEYVTYRILFAEKQTAVIPAQMYFYYINKEGITKKSWSPKRLHILDAMEQQMIYMREHNYERAYVKAVQSFAYCLAESYQRIQENCPFEKEWLHTIRNKLQKLLRQSFVLLELEKNYYLYETAFPVKMKIYWSWQAVKRRLKRNA